MIIVALILIQHLYLIYVHLDNNEKNTFYKKKDRRRK